jgi:hypothetical protein
MPSVEVPAESILSQPLTPSDTVQESETKVNMSIKPATIAYNIYENKSIMKHISSNKVQKKLFSCAFCNFTNSLKATLIRHVASLHYTQYSGASCCGIKFQSICDAQLHRDSEHLNGYTCDFCSDTFKYPAFKRRHMLMHTQIAPYNCNTCKYSTKYEGVMLRHMANKNHWHMSYTFVESSDDAIGAKPEVDGKTAVTSQQPEVDCTVAVTSRDSKVDKAQEKIIYVHKKLRGYKV